VRRPLLLSIVVLSVPVLGAAESPADLVLTGGSVYTMDAARSWAEAVAVREGRIANGTCARPANRRRARYCTTVKSRLPAAVAFVFLSTTTMRSS